MLTKQQIKDCAVKNGLYFDYSYLSIKGSIIQLDLPNSTTSILLDADKRLVAMAKVRYGFLLEEVSVSFEAFDNPANESIKRFPYKDFLKILIDLVNDQKEDLLSPLQRTERLLKKENLNGFVLWADYNSKKTISINLSFKNLTYKVHRNKILEISTKKGTISKNSVTYTNNLRMWRNDQRIISLLEIDKRHFINLHIPLFEKISLILEEENYEPYVYMLEPITKIPNRRSSEYKQFIKNTKSDWHQKLLKEYNDSVKKNNSKIVIKHYEDQALLHGLTFVKRR